MNTTIALCANCGTKNRIPADKQHRKPKCGKCNTAINMKNYTVPVELDDAVFSDFISSASLPVMVDFFSPTCGPCHMLAPTIDVLAKKFSGRAIVAKLDTSRYQMTPARFRIRGVPTLIFFKNGQVADQITGAAPEQTIAQMLNQLL
jgi:thioredoxin 2